MGRKRKNVQDDLPSSDRTREILLDKSGFLQDTKRLRTKLDEIHRAAIRSYRNGIVDPREIVPKTARRIGITPDKNPRKYAILLMTVGIMSANLLQRTVQQHALRGRIVHQRAVVVPEDRAGSAHVLDVDVRDDEALVRPRDEHASRRQAQRGNHRRCG